jgi:hypothetical protein
MRQQISVVSEVSDLLPALRACGLFAIKMERLILVSVLRMADH